MSTSRSVGDPKNIYLLRSDASKAVRTLVRPSRLILGCGVRWRIAVSGSIRSIIDNHMQSHTRHAAR